MTQPAQVCIAINRHEYPVTHQVTFTFDEVPEGLKLQEFVELIETRLLGGQYRVVDGNQIVATISLSWGLTKRGSAAQQLLDEWLRATIPHTSFSFVLSGK